MDARRAAPGGALRGAPALTRVLFLAEHVELSEGGDQPPHGSGAHAAASLAGLRAHFDVLPVTAGPAGADPSRIRPLRGLVPPRVRGARHDVLALRADARFAARAAELARDFRPDVVYERSEYLVRAGTRLSAHLRVPLVLEVNGLVADEVRTMYRSTLEPLGARLERRKLRRADAIVVESPGMAEAVAALGAPADRIAIVPNSVAPSRLRAAPRAANPDRAVVAWIGHLMPWHLAALEFLVGAAGRIVEAEPRIRFAVFGGGPGMESLAERAAAAGLGDAFAFHGVVPYAELAARLEEVDVGLVPDTPPHKLPVKMVELGAAGLPLVAPRSPSLDRQLEPFVEYQPFARGDAASLCEALLAVVRDLDLRTRLAARLHEAVRERFTWDATGARLRAVVEGVLAR